MITLGQKAKDKVTGLKGIITGKWQTLYGSDLSLIKPSIDKEGNTKKGYWFNDGRIEITGKGISLKELQTKKPGGPQLDSPRG